MKYGRIYCVPARGLFWRLCLASVVQDLSVALKHEEITTTQGLRFLRHCYWFVDKYWQQIPREQLPDQGFEINFRSSCIKELKDWQISQAVELGFGEELTTASGVRHEIDLVARQFDTLVISEFKNRLGCPPGKNDVIIFFAKILDYLAHNPKLLLSEVLPVFISTCAFEESTLAACLGLGIHPVAPGLRPLPVLADNLMRIENEIRRGFSFQDDDIAGQWDDVCAGHNRLVLGLDQTWLSARCGYVTDEVINLRKTFDIESVEGYSRFFVANTSMIG